MQKKNGDAQIYSWDCRRRRRMVKPMDRGRRLVKPTVRAGRQKKKNNGETLRWRKKTGEVHTES